MYYDSLQHTAAHYNTLQQSATQDRVETFTSEDSEEVTTLQHALQLTATHCNTLQHTTTHCNTLQHTAMQDKVETFTSKHSEEVTYGKQLRVVVDDLRHDKLDVKKV